MRGKQLINVIPRVDGVRGGKRANRQRGKTPKRVPRDSGVAKNSCKSEAESENLPEINRYNKIIIT
jgi:hypothetical protein